MVEVLHEAGYPVRATDLASAYESDDLKRGRFPSVIKRLGVEFVPSDLTDPDSLEAVVRDVGYVFHVAAIFSYSAPWSLLEKVNVQGTRSLLELLRYQQTFKKLVFWAAGGVYDLKAAALPVTEQSPIGPANDYLRSKWQAEELIREFCDEHKMAYSMVRGTTVYGPRGVYGGGQMLMAAATMPVAAVPMNWTFRIPFGHVRDVCGAALHVAEKPTTDGEDYIVNDDSQLTNVEFFEFVAALTGHPFVKLPPVPVGAVKAVAGPVARTLQWLATNVLHTSSPLEADTVDYLGLDVVYSNEKLRSTGYELVYPDARHGISDTIRWYQKQGWI
jgi:nucleoside-diphosphate-sugar epimerase